MHSEMAEQLTVLEKEGAQRKKVLAKQALKMDLLQDAAREMGRP